MSFFVHPQLQSLLSNSPYHETTRLLFSIQPLQLARRVEVFEAFSNTGRHGLLTLANPNPRVEIFLVWFVFSVRIANLLHQVVLLIENVIPNTSQVSVLQIGIKVDFNNTIANGI